MDDYVPEEEDFGDEDTLIGHDATSSLNFGGGDDIGELFRKIEKKEEEDLDENGQPRHK